MAAHTRDKSEKPKRIRKRKARTEVSSDSFSDSSSDTTSSDEQSEAEEKVIRVEKKQKGTKTKPSKVKSHSSSPLSTDPSATVASVPDSPTTTDAHTANQAAEDAFTSFYLRQMTTEFAEDLDKIRSAGDFDNKSISMLVAALQQGRSCFTEDERLSVGRSIAMQGT